MVLKQFSYDVGYPVYGAKFLNEDTLLITGGGGEGNNGIPNKLTALKVDFSRPKALKKFRELSLLDNEDSPMSLDASKGVIILGVNQDSASIKNGTNKHFRKFIYSNEHLKAVDSAQISDSRVSTEYQKLTVLTPDGAKAVIAMSKDPSTIYVVDTNDLDVQFEIKASGDVKDICISPDGKVACYITASTLETVSTVTGRTVLKHDSFPEFALGKVAFLDNNTILIAGVLKQGGGVVLAEFSIPKSAVVKSRVVSKKLKGITSMDVSHGLVALAGSDTSITIVRATSLKIISTTSQVHNFAITKITFSSDGTYLASVSAANTVNIILIPKNFASAKSKVSSVIGFLFWSVLLGVLAMFVQWFIQSGNAAAIFEKSVKLIKKTPHDSTPYFKIEPIAPSETFIKISSSSAYSYRSSSTTTLSEEMFTILPVGEPDVKIGKDEPEKVATILPVGEPDVKISSDEPEQLASILPVGQPIIHTNAETKYVPQPDLSSSTESVQESIYREPITNTQFDTETPHLTDDDLSVGETKSAQSASSAIIPPREAANASGIDSALAETVYSVTESVTDSGSDIETETEREAEVQADIGIETGTEVKRVTEAENEFQTETGTELVTDIDFDTETSTDALTETDTEIQTETETEVVTETGSETQVEISMETFTKESSVTGVISETETESVTESEVESVTDSEASETDAESDVGSVTESEVSETDTESGVEPSVTASEVESEVESVTESEVESLTDSEVSETDAESDVESVTESEVSETDIESATDSRVTETKDSEAELENFTAEDATKAKSSTVSASTAEEITSTGPEVAVTPTPVKAADGEEEDIDGEADEENDEDDEDETVTLEVTLTSTLTQTVTEDQPETVVTKASKSTATAEWNSAATATATVVEILTVFQTIVETIVETVTAKPLPVHDDL
ncbi:unnamed protein product [Kuraishia capsulata CBS 1993]|uniref:Guanine nucleotide-exchange factor SEC12 n=1 Tax=Kuraishia capsulata CBS 1993 TaxID=1382522 RepID=W6MRL5_9ASCO|nr:uncharacterized protein KUCA_T00004979001 [Kuraishia capsulata CBS 1993]CDK28993.1 unnamed protein product [Kuraishia capsulata CBS 1993]